MRCSILFCPAVAASRTLTECGNVADERDILFCRFVGDCEIRFPGDREYLDEIQPPLLYRVHRPARVLWSIHRDGLPVALPGRQKGAGQQEMRTQQFSTFDPFAPPLKHIRVAAHVPDAGDAVGDVERVNHLFVPRRGNEGAVHMHVPQSRDQVFAMGIDDLNVPALADKPHLGQAADPSLLDHQGYALSDLAVAHAHNVYVGENEDIIVSVLRLRPGPQERDQQQPDDQRYLHAPSSGRVQIWKI